MNVFLQELRFSRRSVLIWSLSLAAFGSLYLLLFGAIKNDLQVFEDVINNFPPVAQAALGFVIGTLKTITGFYAFAFTYVVLCGAVQATNLGVSAIGREIGGNTADFLLTKPRARSSILAQKALAVLVSLVVTNAIFLGITIPVAAAQQSDLDVGQFVLLSATLFFVQLVFAALGLLYGVAAKKIKSVVAVSLPAVFAFFVVGMLGAIIGEDKIRYFTPFKYFDTGTILKNSAYETTFCLVAAAVVIVAVAASFAVFAKKDVHAL